MFSFGRKSSERLETCCEELQTLGHEVIKYYDFSVLEGYRSLNRQQALFRDGRTTIDGITQTGKHNIDPSDAFDLLPYPSILHGVSIWGDRSRFYLFVGLVCGIAHSNGISIRVGADWDGDGSARNQSFHDLPHIEVTR
jgi:hypothetical protein